jgi:hypothetical protein
MSRIFDVLLEQSGPYHALGEMGHQRFKLEKYGRVGPNQVCLPNFTNESQLETLIFSKGAKGSFVNSELSEPGIRAASKEFQPHKLEFVSDNIQKVQSYREKYWEFDDIEGRSSSVIQLSPNLLEKNNKSIYLLKIKAHCGRQDWVELQMANGDKLSVCGEFELYTRDVQALSILARIPYRGGFRVSYAQILPSKNSILKILSRSQYGQSPLQS